MAVQTVFKRFEIKYIITEDQCEKLKALFTPYMKGDEYGNSTIKNIYFDTPSHLLIRNSIDKPIYKEKLRIRSYGQSTANSKVFVELKKKYDGIVYKRRIELPHDVAFNWISGDTPRPVDTQISREIEYFTQFYGNLKPAVFLSYEREAYYEKNGGSFRITFDDNILFRTDALTLLSDTGGHPLLEDGKVLMELKCSGGIPLWLVNVLSEEKIYKTSFSKYGTGYIKYILPNANNLTTQEKIYAINN